MNERTKLKKEKILSRVSECEKVENENDEGRKVRNSRGAEGREKECNGIFRNDEIESNESLHYRTEIEWEQSGFAEFTSPEMMEKMN